MTNIVKVIIVSLTLVSSAAFGKVCELKIAGTDTMQFDQKELAIDSTCKKVKLTLTHTGKLSSASLSAPHVVTRIAEDARVPVYASPLPLPRA